MLQTRIRRRTAALAATAAALSLLAAACGSDDGDGGATPSPSGNTADAVNLSGVCPSTVVIQDSWLPSTTGTGNLYQLLGPDPDIDGNKKRVTAPLVVHGKKTGVNLEIRAGGPAIGYTTTSAQMYTDKSITLGVPGGFDESIQLSAKQQTTAVMALMEKDPQMIMWDPETHPDWKTIADIGRSGTKVLYFGGDTYMEWLLAKGILKKKQVDGSFDGSPSQFVASRGKIAVSGYAGEDPYTYEKEVKQWHKPVKFQMLYDAGYPIYGPPLLVRTPDKAKLAPCLKKLIPIIQQAQVDFVKNPGPAIDVTVKIAEAYKGGDVFTKAIGDYGVREMKRLGLASDDAEGGDHTAGNFDEKRVQHLIDILKPIFAKEKKPIKDGLKASDVATNEFIDPKISYGR